MLKIPFNRLVAFAGPYISVASGAVASWLLVHVHFLGLFHVQHDGLASAIAQGVVFLVTTLVTWAGHSKWLKGHHIELANGVTTTDPLGNENIGDLETDFTSSLPVADPSSIPPDQGDAGVTVANLTSDPSTRS